MAGLLREQRNELFRVIREAGLDPGSFNWECAGAPTTGEPWADALRYGGSGFYFCVRWQVQRGWDEPGHRVVEMAPGVGTPHYSESVQRWDHQVKLFRAWLWRLKSEVEEPDLWEQLAQSQIGPGLIADPEGGNRAFTVAEAKQITAGVEAMREYLAAECPEVDRALDEINEKLDYLKEAAERQGRMDWMHMFIGALVSTGIDRLLTPEHGHRLMELLKGTVSGIVKLLS